MTNQWRSKNIDWIYIITFTLKYGPFRKTDEAHESRESSTEKTMSHNVKRRNWVFVFDETIRDETERNYVLTVHIVDFSGFFRTILVFTVSPLLTPIFGLLFRMNLGYYKSDLETFRGRILRKRQLLLDKINDAQNGGRIFGNFSKKVSLLLNYGSEAWFRGTLAFNWICFIRVDYSLIKSRKSRLEILPK